MFHIRLLSLMLMLTALPAVAQHGLRPMFAAAAFEQPVFMLQVPGNDRQWVVIERHGRAITLRADGSERRTLFDLRDRVDSGPIEAGLLGIAFHPRFAENGRLFLSYTRDGSPLISVLAEYRSADNGHSIDAQSERVILETPQPYSNHNGGHVSFGPDGYLYYGLGDGGSGGDPEGNGQNPHTLLGAILRLDVDGKRPYAIPPDNPFAKGGGRGEIYAWGLRNPWRWSFDRQSGALWVGDVGQDQWEEASRVRKGDNLGWNRWEGLHCYSKGCDIEGVVMPRVEYGHDQGCSITGGYIYHGRTMPELLGHYLYGDFCSGTVWALDAYERHARPRVILRSDKRISSFAEGRDGELYLLDFASGRIFQIISK